MKKIVTTLVLTMLVFIASANNSNPVKEPKNKVPVFIAKTVSVFDAPDSYEKPIPCAVIIEDDNGHQYAGYGEGITEKEACDKAYQEAMSHM